MNKKTRLERLERQAKPTKIIVVFKEDGRMWTSPNVDYRGTLNPDNQGNCEVTPEQLAELEQKYQVILVQFVDMDMNGEQAVSDDREP